jgi:hypothetical protein
LAVCAVVLAFYLLFVHRWREVLQKDGWLLQYTYIRLRCPTCLGRIERLECNGRPVPMPAVKSGPGGQGTVLLVTPVGSFRSYANLNRWRFEHGQDNRSAPTDPAITQQELAQCYYDNPVDDGYELYGRRKKGTPSHWCWAFSTDHSRWLDPVQLDKLDW